MVRPPIIASSFSQVMERCGFFGEVHRILSEFSDLPLPAQLDVERFGRVLDVACGDGTWLLEMARLNPELNFVGQRSCLPSRHKRAMMRTKFEIMSCLLSERLENSTWLPCKPL